MATDTLTIPYVRQGTDIHLALWLRSESEYAYWSGVTVRRVWMWSCEQKAFAGRCEIVGISSDETTLEVKWPHDKQMYVGLHSVVVELVMNGDVQTYDQKAVNMVRSTEDVEGDETIDVEAIPVGIVIAAITSGGSIPGPAGVKLYDGPGQNNDGAMTQKATTDAIDESREGITEEVDTALAAKQDVIPDLATIRSGAAAGATAVQPSALDTKQDTISDLATIRSGAAAGATAYKKPNTGIPQSDLAAALVAIIQKAVANVSSNEDGAVVITLVNGDTYTIDLNHTHPDKQDLLVSGTNIKTINNQSILGDGNIDIQGGATITVDSALSGTSENPVQNKVVKGAIDAKQDTISDLSAIRSGASAGSTAYQKPSAGIPASDLSSGVQASLTPSVSASDNGKVLMVVSGAWAKATPVTVYSGSAAPTSAEGIDGDVYLQTQ